MKVTHGVGIDPGMVHTGCVRAVFKPELRRLLVEHHVVLGNNAPAVNAWIDKSPGTHGQPYIFIEDYNPRSAFSQDRDMVVAVRELRQMTGGKVLSNTGVKQVIRRPLMEVLGLWRFSTPTHHQDLRSAARILVYGMLKDDELNAVVTQVLMAHLEGNPWTVVHLN